MNRTLVVFARTLMCGLFILFTVTIASAQFKAGVQGTVTDTGRGLIPEANVTLTNTETGRTQEDHWQRGGVL